MPCRVQDQFAGAGEPRSGYRHRELDTRAATIDGAIPKLCRWSYFPDWLLQSRKRAEAGLISVVATLGITPLSKSQVWRMAADLDEWRATQGLSMDRPEQPVWFSAFAVAPSTEYGPAPTTPRPTRSPIGESSGT